MKIGSYLNTVREQNPLVHNITNYVTVNDVANIELACGASPIMSDALEEMDDLAQVCNALNINIGTITSTTLTSMIAAVKANQKSNHPIIIDMVGVGASSFRYQAVLQLLALGKVSVIKGNASEIETLYSKKAAGKGVDATALKVNIDTTTMCQSLAKQYECIVVCTGKKDVVADADKAIIIKNGCQKMGTITGSGCQLSGLIAAFIACDDSVECVACAVAMMSIAGELANDDSIGNSTYRNLIIDQINLINGECIDKELKYEIK